MKNLRIDKLFLILFALSVAVATTSCYQEEDLNLNKEIIGLGGEDIAQNEIDQWLYTNFVQPYNIEVK